MGYTNLKSILDAYVKTNGSQSITGAGLNNVMTQILQGVDIPNRENPADTSGLGYLVLDKSKTFAEQVTETDTIYEIRDAFSLGGSSFSIPAGCVLHFNGGELTNGSIAANNTIFTGDYDGKIKVSVTGTNATPDFRISHFSDAVDTSKFASARKGVVVLDDVNIDTNVDLYCDVRGISRNVKISVAGSCNYGFHVVSPNVTISNITIEKAMPASGTQHAHLYREAIQGIESNLSVINCTIKGGISLYNTDTSKVVTGCFVRDCDIIADFSAIPDDQATMIKDVLFFYGCSNIWVEDNNIVATNVLRIFKTSALITSSDYSTYVQNPDNVHICRNKIVANSTLGKQFIDMYCGTRNVYIKDNYIYMRGHSDVFEDKTIYSDGTQKYHVIEGNVVDTDSQVCFASMSTNDTFIFRKNKIKVTNYSLSTAPFNIKGCDFIFNYNRLEFVGTYTYVTMTFGVSDSENVPINKADVIGNIFVNTRRLQPQHLLFLNYTDNDVDPQEQEIDINTTRSLIINFRKRIFRKTTTPLFYNQMADASNVKIYLDAYHPDQMISRCSTNTDAAKTKLLSGITTEHPVFASPTTNAQYYVADSYNSMSLLDGCMFTSGAFRVRFNDLNYSVTHTPAGWRSEDGLPIVKRLGTKAQREALTLTSAEEGAMFYDTTLDKMVLWNGSAWVNMDGSALA